VLPGIAGLLRKVGGQAGPSDPRLDRKYCNDPEAVNYNRDFPGTADNSVCYYPSDAFSGQYSFVDSIYDQGEKLIKEESLTLVITRVTNSKFKMEGLCGAGGTIINFTSNRQLHADADTIVTGGQILCRPKDTLSGYIAQNPVDSNRIRFTIQVVSDTAINLHQGMAYRL
jgi:hypothetical protein